ncbi:MAG: hypothetical protein WBA51_19440 [Erythrobacter sp.]
MPLIVVTSAMRFPEGEMADRSTSGSLPYSESAKASLALAGVESAVIEPAARSSAPIALAKRKNMNDPCWNIARQTALARMPSFSVFSIADCSISAGSLCEILNRTLCRANYGTAQTQDFRQTQDRRGQSPREV